MQGNVKLMRSSGMLAAWNIHVEQVAMSTRLTRETIENENDLIVIAQLLFALLKLPRKFVVTVV